MKHYEVHFAWQDQKRVEIVECEDPRAAVVTMMRRYPGACIGFIRKVV